MGSTLAVRAISSGLSVNSPAKQAQGHRDEPGEGLLYPVKVPRAVIVADDGLNAAGKAVVEGEYDLHHAVEDGHGAHIQVAAVGLQAVVEHQGDSAFRELHDERRNAQGTDTAEHLPAGTEIPGADAQR